MKTLDKWNSFTPSVSKVDNFFGGIRPEYTFDQFKNRNTGGFCAVTYRLQVNSAQNGYHHFMGMYTSTQGVAWSNACVKEYCRSGEYQFNLHFNFPLPTHNPGVGPQGPTEHLENSYRYTMFYGQDSNTYGTDNTWTNNNIMDIMVLRPTLVNSQNANDFIRLWDANTYNGWQMYFTGYPVANPTIVNGTNYDL
jgi:hypothetical protein